MSRPMEYVKDHWLGRHSITVSIWLNLVFPFATLLLIHRLVLNELVARSYLPAIPTTVVLLVLYSVLLLWQLVGIHRSSHRERLTYGSTTDVYIVYALVFVLVLFIVVNLLDVLTNENSHGKPKHMAATGLPPIEPAFTILPSSDVNGRVQVTGLFGIAATRQLSEYLNKHTDIISIELSSDGGSVFEARGVGRLIKKHGLSTHVSTTCLSACTLAFVHGTKRSAVQGATFGFHSYRVDADFPVMGLDVDQQQQLDRQLFIDNGVSIKFVNNLYKAAADRLWYPSLQELLESNFLTE